MFLRQYDFDVVAIKGNKNSADYLSRWNTKKLERNESNKVDICNIDLIVYNKIVDYMNTLNIQKNKLYKKSAKDQNKKKVLNETNAIKTIKEIHNETHEIKQHLEQKDCKICRQYGNNINKNSKLIPIIARRPFEILGLNAVGLIQPISKNGSRYIITTVDYFTK
ncbi:hypothetical protein BB561_002707 [Smittium simulii]|uniref:Integrase catalytic domain-containing protein n=1 Tax=Smittium simulii TaxID=133385 RepID=A0A2T9YPL2_9FUNG|nr:hypothetical protein BB561_002707 [Smittium simulii]